MGKSELFAILQDWNNWVFKCDPGILREDYLGRLEELVTGSKQVVVITGPRRAGKSFIMRQFARRLLALGVAQSDIFFVNFDDPRFMSLDVKVLADLYEAYLEMMSPLGIPYVFLDEVQNVPGWERWVRYIHELGKARIIVSGSNAHLLSHEFGTVLTGRHVNFTVFPLSFREFLKFKEIDEVNDGIAERLFREYIENGGFPEVVLSREKFRILLDYFDDVLSKDIVQRFKVRKIGALKVLLRHYLSNIGNLTTFSSLERKIGVTADTVERFSNFFEDAYLVFLLRRFSFKAREQEKSPRKVYAVDTGLCNVAGFRFSENIGRLAENVVYLHLRRDQIFNPALELFYWKDVHHREVDFVIKEGHQVKVLLQVCWDMSDERVVKRELGGLKRAMRELNCDNAIIITGNEKGQILVDGIQVRLLPIWEYLVSGQRLMARNYDERSEKDAEWK